ncbi:MAG: DUF5702 domain-containing protein [Lachnospiraceae bacterium]|jgi:hypothetical protein|nr:DUF5702 domain-containing protein [Lachnospiraceae bacterium]MEE3460428.1 DUF5702 domain-containing protein [Lachnospiraceae bacterium]
MIRKNKEKASITVFLSLFTCVMLFFIFAMIDMTRYTAGSSYVKTSADNAAMSLFGDYDRELFSDYHLLMYGGYDGIDQTDVMLSLKSLMTDNFRSFYPDEGSKFTFMENMAGRFPVPQPLPSGFDIEAIECRSLNDPEILSRQISEFIKNSGISAVTGIDGLNGLTDLKHEDNVISSSNDIQSRTYKEEEEKKKEAEKNGESLQEDKTRHSLPSEKNPLHLLVRMAKSGLLSFVIDTSEVSTDDMQLSEVEVKDTYQEAPGYSENGFGDIKENDKDALKVTKGLFGNNRGFDLTDIGESPEKLEFAVWAEQVFDSYINGRDKYELEYIASGRMNKADALYFCLNRLLIIRTLECFAVISKDPAIKAQSLRDAGLIAGALASPEFTDALSITILSVMSLEEAMIDISALLQERKIPLIKKITDVKLKYGEIMLASREFFAEKASEWPLSHRPDKSDKPSYESFKMLSSGQIDYISALDLLVIPVSKENRTKRSCMLIQKNIRDKYNDNFTIDNGASAISARVTYTMDPVLLPSSAVFKAFKERSFYTGFSY